ncbi:DNA adenine methylase [Priestia flexa]|uniref:DNA adenine methylase n=1 Tax=Priestia flexa TaxID=86664 RepID=UPI000473C861|nr:DNA adenine methylase [Priestia flexa]
MNKTVKSPIKWVGGKSKLVNKLLPLFPEHRCYVEVFGGAGWTLFGKEPSRVEILNDFDSNLMNFWSVVQNAKDQLIDSMQYTLVSRELFDEYKQKYKNNDFNDAIEQARVFYYLVNAGFASDMKNPVFGTKSQSRNGLRPESIEQSINDAYKRLQKVTIENKSFENIFKIYDNEETFFYLDSPYRNTKQYAVGKFTDEQYELLADCCKKAKGKWLYTINNDEYIKELFKGFNIMDHDVYYSVCKTENGRTNFKELIITNYDI